MDEDEKEMLSEARARLANTRCAAPNFPCLVTGPSDVLVRHLRNRAMLVLFRAPCVVKGRGLSVLLSAV